MEFSNISLITIALVGLLGCVTTVYGQANSVPSVIIGDQYFPIAENTPIGSVINSLKVIDADGGSLTFQTATPQTSNIVEIQPAVRSSNTEWLYNITLKSPLDRDGKPSRVELFFDVDDGTYKIPTKLVMIITDVNDNPPILTGVPYRTSIPENFEVDTNLYQFSAEDVDTGKGSSVLYSMEASVPADEAEYSATFSLDTAQGVVTLKKKLDYETRSFYHFKVSARDEGNPPCPGPDCLCKGENCNGTVADFFITVKDVEDTPPVFERLPYFGTVSENKPINYVVLTVKARDGDRGVAQPSPIVYSLSDENVPFSIDASGEIKVAKKLDADGSLRERGGLYFFNVTATESTSNQITSTVVSITVEDYNDNPPAFNAKFFSASVLENTPKGVPLTMNSTITVKDIDQGLNSRFRVFVRTLDGHPYDDFSTIPSESQILQGSTSVTVVVNNSTLLDFESISSISFMLVTQEVVGTGSVISLGSQSSSAVVNITIKDTNDNSPVFADKDASYYTVPENAGIGYVIHRFSATDSDSGDFGRVEFSMETGVFAMAPDGNLTVAKNLDREKQDSYFIVVTASDNPDAPFSQQRKTQLRVTIRVTDVNDNDPKWNRATTIFRIPETDQAGTIVAVLRATDEDIGKNGELEYSIKPGTNGSHFFDVRDSSDNQTELYINKNLTSHPGLYLVNVMVKDKGDHPREASLEVKVTVTDINLDPPYFTNPNMTGQSADYIPVIKVEEEQPKGTVIYTLRAVDEGIGDYGLVSYEILSSTNNDDTYFSVDRKTGNITMEKRLDREAKDTYEIQVKAKDRGLPVPLSTTITMRIKLTDKSDFDPIYVNFKIPQIMTVLEEKWNASIGLVQNATDLDLVKQICYYLCDDQDSLYPNVQLDLDKHNRNLSLIGKVDREKLDKFDVQVLASSSCDVKPSTICSGNENSVLKIQVTVNDTDDNPPRFASTKYSRSVPYDKQVDYEVMDLKDQVIDEDISPNNQHLFRLKGRVILSPDMSASFSSSKQPFIVTASGYIRTNALFRADLTGYFLLRVEVYEEDNPDFNNVTEVKISVVTNEQRVRLVFSKLPGEVRLIIDDLAKDLSNILGLNITVGAIKTHTKSDGSRDTSKTDAFIYARKKDSDDFLTAAELQELLDFNNNARTLLFKRGVQKAQRLTETEADDGDEMLKRLFVILVTVLSILVVALILVLINIIRMYRRRLKAATTMAYVSPKQQEMYEHPGTNKYYTAENPLFGKEIKAPELEEDRTSTNSLDVNAVDQKSPSKIVLENPEEEQEVVLQIMDSNLTTPQHNGHVNHNVRLNKVLEEYENSVHINNNKNKTKPPPPPPPPMPQMNGVNGHINNNSLSQVKGQGIPGLGQDVQEAVTRFSDDGSRSKPFGFPETIHEISTHHGNLEYTEI